MASQDDDQPRRDREGIVIEFNVAIRSMTGSSCAPTSFDHLGIASTRRHHPQSLCERPGLAGRISDRLGPVLDRLYGGIGRIVQLYQSWEPVDPEKWVTGGYASVRVNSRMRGVHRAGSTSRHPGDPRLLRLRRSGGEPALVQRQSRARRFSYYAINQWQVAALQPPHLAAICVWEGAFPTGTARSPPWRDPHDVHRDWFETQVRSVQHGLGDRGPRTA